MSGQPTRIPLGDAGWVSVICEIDLATVSKDDMAFLTRLAEIIQERPKAAGEKAADA